MMGQEDLEKALIGAKESGDFAGAQGEKGDAGYTPVRGKDYWTEEDKGIIKDYLEEVILGGVW